jgi:hypothetical protein
MMTLWSIEAAPLLLGTDLTTLDRPISRGCATAR